jgi:hypothetical protein
MFQAVSTPIIKSSKTVHTASGKCQASYVLDAVCTVLEPLMMGREAA